MKRKSGENSKDSSVRGTEIMIRFNCGEMEIGKVHKGFHRAGGKWRKQVNNKGKRKKRNRK